MPWDNMNGLDEAAGELRWVWGESGVIDAGRSGRSLLASRSRQSRLKATM